MMQHVATSKSEVAAFATGAESNSPQDFGANTQFGKILQDHEASAPVTAKSNPASQQSHSHNSRQSNDKSKGEYSSSDKEGSIHNKSASNRDSKSENVVNTNSSQRKHGAKGDDAPVYAEKNEKISEKANSKDLVNSAKDKSESQQVSAASQDLNESNEESSEIVADQWVELIDNLKKLAGSDESLLSSLQELDESHVDLTQLNQSEKALLDQISDSEFADNSRISLDGYIPVPASDGKESNTAPVVLKKTVEQTLSTDENQTNDSQNADIAIAEVTNTQSAQNISELIDQALAEVLASSDAKDLSQAEVYKKTAELLLDKPEVLQKFLTKLQRMTQTNDSVDKDSIDVAVTETNQRANWGNQQLENAPPTELTSKENQNLLRVLVAESEAKTGKFVESDLVSKVTPTKESEIATKVLMPEPNSVAQTENQGIEQRVEQGVEQDVQVEQLLSNKQLNLNNRDKTAANRDVINILNLESPKLQKVLENIAQRVFESTTTSESNQPEKIALQVLAPKAADIISANVPATKDFIAALKTGLEEFKNQVSQGREPGIDLKGLISEALTKTTDSGATTVVKSPVNLEQIAGSVSQVLDLAQSMNRSIEERHDQIYSATLREVVQVQGEQSKQLQLNQLESKFDKAVNIAKPEGHQQLAEKVRWMVNTKNLVAEIRLDPAELGSVNVKVAVSGESATVNFVVQSQAARDAVDNATPRLREMLAEKGIELGQSSVRQENNGKQSQGDSEFSGQGGTANDELENLEVPEKLLAQQNIVNGTLGGIDYFV